MSSSDSDSSSSDEEVEQKTVAVKEEPEEDSSSDSDSEEEEKPTKAAPAKAADSSSDSDSSDDEEEEEKPAPTKAAAKDSDSDSDSSSDDEEEEKPKAAPAKVEETNDDSSDSDSSDDEEEEKPAKKEAVAESDQSSSSSDEADDADETMEDVEFTPTKAGSVTVLFEWNLGGKEAGSRKRKLSKASLPAAKKPKAKKKESSAPKPAASKPAPAAKEETKSSSAGAKEVTIQKEFNPEDFRSSELKDTTDTIFVKGIDINAEEKDIKEFFTEHVAEPVSIRHKWEEERPGLAWVTFASPQQASKAVIDCNREYIKDRYVFTDWAKPQVNRGGAKHGSGPRNAHLKDTTNRVWCGNVHREVDQDALTELFKETGAPTDVYIIQGDGYRPQIAFISFETNEIASQVVEKFQGHSLMGNNIRLDWAEPRKDSGGGRGGRGSQELSEKPEGCLTCFVGRLSDTVDDDKLQELFKESGEISSIRYMERDGEFKGVAFVEFADTAFTDKAVLLNGTSFLGKNIRVDFAADRKKKVYAEDWDCKACGATGNFGSRTDCFKCGEPKA